VGIRASVHRQERRRRLRGRFAERLQSVDVAQPLAPQVLRVILATACKPKVELLHVLESHLVEQVVVGFALWIEACMLMPGLIYRLLLQLTLRDYGFLLGMCALAHTVLGGLGQNLAIHLGAVLNKLVE